jgi:hypothetical protein
MPKKPGGSAPPAYQKPATAAAVHATTGGAVFRSPWLRFVLGLIDRLTVRSRDDDPKAFLPKRLGQPQSLASRILFRPERSCYTIHVDSADNVPHLSIPEAVPPRSL